MSANNWAICPRCLRRAQQGVPAAIKESYGQVPLEKFMADVAAVKPVSPEDFRTFREDYEIYIRDGKVVVSYSGHCQTCGLGLNFTERKPIPEVNDD